MIKDIDESKYELYQYGKNRHIIKTTKHAKAGVKTWFHIVEKNLALKINVFQEQFIK